jgi:hypothetical protein
MDMVMVKVDYYRSAKNVRQCTGRLMTLTCFVALLYELSSIFIHEMKRRFSIEWHLLLARIYQRWFASRIISSARDEQTFTY